MIARLAVAAVIWAVPPAPSPMPTIHYQACPQPGWEMMVGCYYGDTDTVYLDQSRAELPFAYEHELGHAYDTTELVDGERVAIEKALRWRSWHVERFADWYAGCRLSIWPQQLGLQVYWPWENLRHVAARCRLIARAGR